MLINVSKTLLGAVVVPGFVTLIMVFVFYPSYLKRTNVIHDIKTFAYGYTQRIGEKEGESRVQTAKLEDLTIDRAALKLGFLRTFTIDTTINLDNAMANMREAIGYSVVREEDMIDTMALIEDIVVPRIMASGKGTRASVPEYSNTDVQDACEESIGDLKAKIAQDPDAEHNADVNGLWVGNCKPGMIEECSKIGADDDLYGSLKCAEKMDSGNKRFENFMWKPRGEEAIQKKSEEECYTHCDSKVGSDGCVAAVYNGGKCYIVGSSNVQWEVDTTSANAGFYNRDSIPIPEYNAGDVVEDIISDIQVISPLMDLTDFEGDIKKRLRESDPNYEFDMRSYDSIITALIRESVIMSDERTGNRDGGNLMADLLVTEEYLTGTTISKFNREIAWPVIKAAVNVAARNQLFQDIADRRKRVFDFHHTVFMLLVFSVAVSCLVYMAVKVVRHFGLVMKHLYPVVPVIVLVLVFVTSIVALLVRRRAKFHNNIQQQSDNATSFVRAIAELSNVFCNDHFDPRGVTANTKVVIPETLQNAVLNDDINGVSFKHGTSKQMVADVYKSRDRENLIRKMGVALEEYDKCNNIMYRGGIPFPTAVVTAYLGLIAIGVGVLFSVPGIGPNKVVRDIEYAEALAIKANDAMNRVSSEATKTILNNARTAYDSYMQKLCALWKESYEDSDKLKTLLQYTTVLLSGIFGVIYIAKTSEDAPKFAKAAGSGIHGIVGDCV
eukprot:jgi/Tetstr1/447273/TSEL_034710.t1